MKKCSGNLLPLRCKENSCRRKVTWQLFSLLATASLYDFKKEVSALCLNTEPIFC